MSDKAHLNGSVTRLAEALRDVFSEALQPVATRLSSLERRMGGLEQGMGVWSNG